MGVLRANGSRGCGCAGATAKGTAAVGESLGKEGWLGAV